MLGCFIFSVHMGPSVQIPVARGFSSDFHFVRLGRELFQRVIDVRSSAVPFPLTLFGAKQRKKYWAVFFERTEVTFENWSSFEQKIKWFKN